MDKKIKAIQRKVLDYIRQKKLIESGDRVLAAVSGGADSVCLLVLLTDLKNLLEMEVEAITVDHGIRGQSAKEDVEYVRKLGNRLGVRVHVCRIDVPAYVKEEGLSEEEAARTLRYRCISEVCEREGIRKTAIGHHVEDSAETILHNLFRGSGLHGLSGILPESEYQGTLIRPLLSLTREEIEEYLKLRQIDYRTDETNFSQEYTRNRIRNRIMPIIKEEINLQAVNHIVQAGNLIGEASQLVEEMAAAWIKNGAVWNDKSCLLNIEGLCNLKPIIRREIYYQIIAELSGKGYCKDITSSHLQAIDGLCDSQVSKFLQMPGRLLIKKSYDGLIFEIEDKDETSIFEKEILIQTEKKESLQIAGAPEQEEKSRITILYPLEDHLVKASVFSYQGEKIPENTYTKWIDYDKIKFGLLLRTRKSGDYITLENGGKKSLKSYLVDKKIPADERDRIPLLCEGAHVIWIGDGRLSSYYKVTEKTKYVMEWRFEPASLKAEEQKDQTFIRKG